MVIYIICKRLVLDFPRVRDYNVGRLTCVKEERKMKIHKKTDLPARDGKEEFSLTVLTCDKRGITNLGYYNFDTEDWGFFMDDYPEYKDTDFVWIYPPEEQMRKILIESYNDEDQPAVPSAKESWYKKKIQPIKKKISLAFKKK